jgi:hypothetical protein
MDHIPHGSTAVAIAIPFVLLAAVFEKQHPLLRFVFESIAWLLLNLW